MAPGDSGESLNLSPEERHVYGQLFRQADPESVGIVMGDAAVKFFEKTRLNARLLGEIWQLADRENRGFLTPAGFSVALRLIGHAQANKEPTAALALSQGPIPQFEGVTTTPLNPQPTGTLSAQGTGSGVGAPQLSAQGSGAPRVPPLPLERATQYARVFQDQSNGEPVLSGEAAKRIFEKSQLGIDVLGRIWQLADTEQRGALVQTEFIIAMHLLTSIKAGTLRSLPTILPAGLYDVATRGAANAAAGGAAPGPGPSSPVAGQRSPLGATFGVGVGGIAPPPAAVGRQMTGMRPAPPNFSNSPLARAAPAPPVPTGGPEWLITPAEKARMNTVFQDLDKLKKGVVTGEQAVPFLQRSGLDDNVLAQIWDLADVKSEGHLTSDTFAVALHLIQQQRQSGGPLPDKLPLNLIPPSMRTPPQQQRPTSPPVAAPIAVPPPQIKSAMDDLFGLDSGPSSTTPSLPALTATPTGAGAGVAPPPSDPFAGSTSPAQPSSPTRSPINNSTTFKPFVPSSAFGRTLTTQATGESHHSAPGAASQIKAVPTPPQSFGISSPPAPAAAQNDLLGGDDGEASRSLSNDTAELANLSNQIGSLSKHMQETSANRSNLQNELSQTSVQKKNFEQRLAQLRALYEKEARDVRALEEQLKTSKAETTKLSAEVASVEASYHELQSQHQTIVAALQADQQENISLKERLKVVSAEVNQIKPQIEKLKSEARQQKGIVAINRKQLSLGESERDKLKVEADDLTRQNQDLARQIQNASVVSSAGSAAAGSAAVSPSVASASGKNPFFRRTGSADIMGVFSGPSPSTTPAPPKSYADRSFDDVFGPNPTSTSPAPSASAVPAAVKPQFTGASTASSTFSAVTAPTSEVSPAMSRQATFTPETGAAVPVSAAATADNVFSPFSHSASSEAPTEVAPVTNAAVPASANVVSPAASIAAPSATTSPAPAAAAIHAAPPAGSESIATKAVSDESAPTSTLGAFGLPAAAATVTAATAGVAAAAVGTNDTTTPATNVNEEKFVWAQGHGKNDSLADPFSSLDDNKDKAKEDFESAFASFKAARADKSSGGGGFDDAFEINTPASGTAATSTFAPIKSDDATAVDTDKAATHFNTEFPPITELTIEDSDSDSDNGGFDDDFAPASPPSKKKTKAVSDATEASLPTIATTAVEANGHSIAESATPKARSPEVAKSAPASTGIFNAPAVPAAPTNMDDIFSVPAATATAPAAAAASTATTSFDNTSFDDLDDFDGLEEAREGSGDEEFANISRSGLDDFQSAFNSSPVGKGLDSGFDFSSLGGASTSVAGVASGSANKAAGDSSDWFSLGADEQKPAAAPATTTAVPAATAADDATRPSVSRIATQESTTTDDPTLQRLTSMGYPRATALSALEKYDYNVERAANFLASQS